MAVDLRLIGVIYNERDAVAVALADRLREGNRKVEACASFSNETLPPVDLLLVLGGDGTFLRGARMVAPFGTRILGVDLGTLGFLAEIQPEFIDEALEQVEAGKFTVEERVMVDVSVLREGAVAARAHGLNDGVVGRGHSGRMIEVMVEADGIPVATYAADGFLVATPTGSTAYALAAGGPVLSPEVPAFVLVPICPHALTARPFVVSDERVVRIQVRPRSEGGILAVDGVQIFEDLRAGDVVEIRKAPFRARLVKLGQSEFFMRLRHKLQWGGRGNS